MMTRQRQKDRMLAILILVLGLSILISGCTRLLSHTSHEQEQHMQLYEQQAIIYNSKTQEREQWREWYEKQWANGNAYRKGVEAYNTLANAGLYGMMYVWDRSQADQESNLLLAGFKKLDYDQLHKWMRFAASFSLDANSPVTFDPRSYRLLQALKLLDSVQLQTLVSWLKALAEALHRGQFDGVYTNLLTQGLNKVEQAILIAAGLQDRQFARRFIQELVRQHSEFLLAQGGPPAEDVARMLTLGMKIALYLLPTNSGLITNPDKAAQFASDFSFLWQVAWASIESFWGRQAANDFTNQLANVINEILNKYSNLETRAGISIPLTCGTGCELVKGLLGMLQWMRPGPVDRGGHDHQYRVEIGAGSFKMLDNVIRQGSSSNPFDKPWQLIGIQGNSESATPPTFDPRVHADPFLVFRISGISGRKDIVVVALGNHCAPCDFPLPQGSTANFKGNTLHLISWIAQAIDQARNAAGRSARGIVTYGFTNPQASTTQTDAVVDVLRSQFANSDIPILIWRIRPDGIVEYTCIGDCSKFTNSELQSIACKEATGSANCNARPWGSSNENNSNYSVIDSGDASGIISAAPPPDEPDERIGARW